MALASMPGAIRLATRMISPRFCRSARTALATPGYCTFTATSRPSFSRARYTCPIDAAATASSPKSSKTSLSRSPRSSSITFRIRSNGTRGAASRSSASFA
jgi:hypothetical protein